MLKLGFDVRDILKGPRLAFSLQRIWIQFVGMTMGYFAYLFFNYAAYLAAGFDLSATWERYGLLPCLVAGGESVPWYSQLLFGLGSLFLAIAYLISNTAVARAAYMLAKGYHFYTWRESFKFAFRKAVSVIFTPLSLGIVIALMVLGWLALGLLGRIPVVGELGISLLTPIWLFGALLLLFIAIVAVVSFLLVPSIIATTDDDAFEAVFQSFSLTWNQPIRLLLYQIVSLVLSAVSLGVLALFVKRSVMILNGLLGGFMGSDYINLANNGQALLQSWLLMGQNIVESIFRFGTAPLIYFKHEFIMIPASELSFSVTISGYLYALGLLFIAGWVLAYGLSTFTTCTMMSYLVLRKNKDNENLLERKDKEEEQEEPLDKPDENSLSQGQDSVTKTEPTS